MLSKTHFELFGLPATFSIDLPQLDQAYRQLQAQVHPDRFATASDHERLLSLQRATQANEAYQTLKNPLSRARYLLQLNGVETHEESNTAMPMEFLMRQMEWREAIDEARNTANIEALETLSRELRHEANCLQNDLSTALDKRKDYLDACETVRKLCFLDKVQAEIDLAFETLE
jgi:molecular chaperone HscB